MKNPTRKTLSNKADKLWRNKVYERDNGKCQKCQKVGNNSHHIIGRRNHTTRWDVDNGILLCPGCHTFRTDSAHQDPLGFAEWFKETYPERYNHLMEIRNEIWDKNYEKVLEGLQ